LLNPLSVCKDESLLPFIRSNNLSIVVCSSFLTSSNMSKNFTEAEGGGYKGIGCHVPQPKPCFSFVSKKPRSRTVPYLLPYVPHGVSSFLNHVNVYYRSR